MLRKLFIIVIFFAICHPIFVNGQNVDYAGTSVANFLKIGMGAHASALGEAYVTSTQDATSMFWNAGAIANIGSGSAVFSTMDWLGTSQITYFAVTVPLGVGTFGFDLDYFSSGDMEITTLQEQDGTGRFFNASDMQVGFAFARSMTDRFSVGLKAKYIREELAHATASTFAFDIGTIFITNFLNDLRIGMTLTNFGGKMQFDGRELSVIYPIPGSPSGKEVPAQLKTEAWELPLYFRAGVSTDIIRAKSFRLNTAYNILDSRDFKTRHQIGAEVEIMNILALRGGYRFNYSEAGLSAGVGVHVPVLGSSGVAFDYAYIDFGRFKDMHQFTLAVKF